MAEMMTEIRSRSLQWILPAFLALAPATALLAQDDATGEQIPGDPGPAAIFGTATDETDGHAGGDGLESEETGEKSEAIQEGTEEGAKVISGMSILGNQEAPTSLVIVPWKSSEIGGSVGISRVLDDSRQPVDREVFMRALSYYQIRSESKP